MMNFEQYRPLALRTAKMFPTQRENLRHAALGLITELGEFATEVKRIAIYGKPMTEDMRLHMVEEAFDAMWYVPLALHAMGLDQLPEPNRLTIDRIPDTNDLAELTLFLAAGCCSVSVYMSAESVDSFSFEDTETLAELMGVIVHIIDKRIAPLIGTTGDEGRAQNIAKLRARFPNAYSDEAAEARADKGGADARNS